MPVREFHQDDIPQVVDLYWRYLCSRRGRPSEEVRTAFAQLYFSSPWVDQRSPSFVYENANGHVVGFLGVTTRQMVFAGECIRVAFGGNFVVHPDARSGVAAARLLRTILDGSQDMTVTDSANDISKPILERLGFHLILPSNIHWSRPLRPSTYLTHMISRAIGGSAGGALRLLGRPVATLLDTFLGAHFSPIPPTVTPMHAEEMTVESLLDCMRQFTRCGSLQPVYHNQSLRWLLAFMQRNRKRGNLRKVLMRDSNQNIVGWYVYCFHPGGIGEVVQVGSVDGLAADVIRALLKDALEHKVIALHGLADSERLPDFSDAGCLFTCRGGWTLAYSRRPEILDALLCGKAHLSRFDGEWCLHPGE